MILMYFLDGPMKGELHAVQSLAPIRCLLAPAISNREFTGSEELPDPWTMEIEEVEYRVVGWHNETAIAIVCKDITEFFHDRGWAEHIDRGPAGGCRLHYRQGSKTPTGV